jgi:hypothetical protein
MPVQSHCASSGTAQGVGVEGSDTEGLEAGEQFAQASLRDFQTLVP